MRTSLFTAVPIAALAGALLCPAAGAAESVPSPDPGKPVTTTRVGGGPADAAFRAAQEQSGQRFSEAKAACRTKPRAERGACMTTARADLRKAQADAHAAREAARRKR